MSGTLPAARPQMDIAIATGLVKAYGVIRPAILAQRGYMRDSMGVKGKNDRGMYDDMIAVVTPRIYRTFNANTDPQQPDTDTRQASLAPGVWDFKRGIHHASSPHGYPCFVQAGPVTVIRDNGLKETATTKEPLGPGGYPPYIHIHRGGYNETLSAGCQTLHPDQWKEFYDLVCREMDFYNLTEIEYVLNVREDA